MLFEVRSHEGYQIGIGGATLVVFTFALPASLHRRMRRLILFTGLCKRGLPVIM